MKTITYPSRSILSLLWLRVPAYGGTIAVVIFSLLAWIFALVFMSPMDEGPGTSLHNLPVFLASWVIMLTAMMLPSEINYIQALAALLRPNAMTRFAKIRMILFFGLGYSLAWVAYGLVAYLLDSAVRLFSPEFIAWNRAGPLLSGSVLIIAGLYQVSTLKHACLTGCRSPIAFFTQYWKEGGLNAIIMGVRRGVVCVGCCWAIMAVMFAVGAMSLTWMALLTLIMFAEKVLPRGNKLTIPIACFLWGMGIWIAISPNTAPFFKYPMMYSFSSNHWH